MYLKARSLSSKKSGYYGTTAKGKEGRLREENYRMKDLLRKQDEKKVQFRKGFDKEKKEISGLVEEKEGEKREVSKLGETKRKLDVSVDELKGQKIEELKGLETISDSKAKIIERAKNIGGEEREKIKQAKTIADKEIQEKADKVEEELRQKVTTAEVSLEKVHGDIKHLEDQKDSLISNNSELAEEGKNYLKVIDEELKTSKENLTSYKEKTEKEIIVLQNKRVEWVNKVSELRGKANLVSGLSSLENEVDRRTNLLRSSVTEIEQEVNSLKAERFDVLQGKVEDEVEAVIRKKEIHKEVKMLEGVIQASKTLQDKEIRVLEIKRFELLGKQGVLEGEIIEATGFLKAEKERAVALMATTSKSLAEEKEKLALTSSSLAEITTQVVGLEKVSVELKDFIEKEGDAKARYGVEKDKLESASRTKDAMVAETTEKVKEVYEKNTQLDEYKENLTDMSNRLTTSLGNVRAVTEELNKRLQGVGADFVFELPPKNIKKIPF